MSPRLRHIPLTAIHVDTSRMHRAGITDDSVRDLATSIGALGLLSPVIVEPAADGFRLVAGQRRLLAVRRLGWTTIQALVSDAANVTSFEIKAAENLERQQLSPYEEALAIADAIEHDALELGDVATRLNRSVAWCTERLAILDWPPTLQQAIHDGSLSLAAARPLAAIPDPDDQHFLIDQARKSGATARTTSAWLQECRHRAAMKNDGQQPEPIHELLATPVVFKQSCFACSGEFPVQELSRLPFCEQCARHVAAAIHPP